MRVRHDPTTLRVGICCALPAALSLDMLATPALAQADDVAAFYAGRTVTFVSGSSRSNVPTFVVMTCFSNWNSCERPKQRWRMVNSAPRIAFEMTTSTLGNSTDWRARNGRRAA